MAVGVYVTIGNILAARPERRVILIGIIGLGKSHDVAADDLRIVGPVDCRPSTQARVARCDIAGRGQVEIYEARSEEHTSELQSLMRLSYAVFCLKKKTRYIYRIL